MSTQPKEFSVSIDSEDDPYADIIVRSPHGRIIARFPQDDAPVPDWNALQRKRAMSLATLLHTKEQS